MLNVQIASSFLLSIFLLLVSCTKEDCHKLIVNSKKTSHFQICDDCEAQKDAIEFETSKGSSRINISREQYNRIFERKTVSMFSEYGDNLIFFSSIDKDLGLKKIISYYIINEKIIWQKINYSIAPIQGTSYKPEEYIDSLFQKYLSITKEFYREDSFFLCNRASSFIINEGFKVNSAFTYKDNFTAEEINYAVENKIPFLEKTSTFITLDWNSLIDQVKIDIIFTPTFQEYTRQEDQLILMEDITFKDYNINMFLEYKSL